VDSVFHTWSKLYAFVEFQGVGNQCQYEKPMKRTYQCTVVLLTMLTSTIAGAAAVDMVLAPPRDPAQGGTLITLDLYLVNNTELAFPPCRKNAAGNVDRPTGAPG
jgi:hypothetical protein